MLIHARSDLRGLLPGQDIQYPIVGEIPIEQRIGTADEFDPVNLLADLDACGISLDELRVVRNEITALCRSWMQRRLESGSTLDAGEVVP